jgi:hypothetical protein
MKSLELPGNSNKQHYADYPIFFREIGSWTGIRFEANTFKMVPL